MAMQRMAGDEIYQMVQAQQSQFEQQNARARSVMERQRQRDMAAAYGKVIPFSSADII
jgi:hypothetical protein